MVFIFLKKCVSLSSVASIHRYVKMNGGKNSNVKMSKHDFHLNKDCKNDFFTFKIVFRMLMYI